MGRYFSEVSGAPSRKKSVPTPMGRGGRKRKGRQSGKGGAGK